MEDSIDENREGMKRNREARSARYSRNAVLSSGRGTKVWVKEGSKSGGTVVVRNVGT